MEAAAETASTGAGLERIATAFGQLALAAMERAWIKPRQPRGRLRRRSRWQYHATCRDDGAPGSPGSQPRGRQHAAGTGSRCVAGTFVPGYPVDPCAILPNHARHALFWSYL